MFAIVKKGAAVAICIALAACASAPPAPSTSVRTRPPQGYEKTISSYFAFRIRGPRKNVEIVVDKPEPGECLLDGDLSGRRGWVVPVVYATRTGELTGKETIQINTKAYYFWFLEDTIAGISPRPGLCPGVGVMSFEDARPSEKARGTVLVATPALPPRTDTPGREGPGVSRQAKAVRTVDQSRGGGQPQASAYEAKKPGPRSGKVRSAPNTAGKCAPASGAAVGSEACLSRQAQTFDGRR